MKIMILPLPFTGIFKYRAIWLTKSKKRVWELRKQTINKYLFSLPGSATETKPPNKE
jgi:hypothetical protein